MHRNTKVGFPKTDTFMASNTFMATFFRNFIFLCMHWNCNDAIAITENTWKMKWKAKKKWLLTKQEPNFFVCEKTNVSGVFFIITLCLHTNWSNVNFMLLELLMFFHFFYFTGAGFLFAFLLSHVKQCAVPDVWLWSVWGFCPSSVEIQCFLKHTKTQWLPNTNGHFNRFMCTEFIFDAPVKKNAIFYTRKSIDTEKKKNRFTNFSLAFDVATLETKHGDFYFDFDFKWPEMSVSGKRLRVIGNRSIHQSISNDTGNDAISLDMTTQSGLTDSFCVFFSFVAHFGFRTCWARQAKCALWSGDSHLLFECQPFFIRRNSLCIFHWKVVWAITKKTITLSAWIANNCIHVNRHMRHVHCVRKSKCGKRERE